jgi:ketohexokinase
VNSAIGAGDTFIAGMLYGLTQHADDWKLKEKLGFANELAGRKVYLNGFGDVVSNYFDERPVSL